MSLALWSCLSILLVFANIATTYAVPRCISKLLILLLSGIALTAIHIIKAFYFPENGAHTLDIICASVWFGYSIVVSIMFSILFSKEKQNNG
jgi:hypothetical protein